MPIYLHIVRKLSSFMIGIMLLPTTIALVLISPFVGKLLAKFSVWKVLASGFLLLSVSGCLQILFTAQTPISIVTVAYVLFGLGWGLILSLSFSSALMRLPKKYGGVATGTLGTLHNAGGSISLAIGAYLFSHSSSKLDAKIFITHQKGPFLFITAVTFIVFCMLTTQLLRERNTSNT